MRTLELREDDEFYYDSEAADHPIRWIEKYLTHYEGDELVGQSFLLLDWQKKIIRDLFGWKKRADNRRRFRELYILTAKGSGKTPLLAALGVYLLLGAREPSPNLVSMASTFEQAQLTFDAGKAYIRESKALSKHATSQQFKIKAHKGYGVWRIASGKPKGRAGPRPTAVIADEVHEWDQTAAAAFNSLTRNLFKRKSSLCLVATNAAESKTGFAYHLHARALAVLEGKSALKTLYPVICEAPLELDWTSEEAARAANPSIGGFVSFDQLTPELAKALENPSDEADYRRLYLSQWAQSSKKWLDSTMWDSRTEPIDPALIKQADLYIGLDLSLVDDLCAAVFVWVTASRFYVDSHFWLPRKTADRYTSKDGIDYLKWAESKHITLTTEPTIGPEIRKQIAAEIVRRSAPYKVKAVCYDRHRAEDTVAALEAAGLVCVDVRQGYTLTPGCEELTRRLTDATITIAPNPVMRMCADNVETTLPDRQGNYWPVKPMAFGQYAGRRVAKIDGIAALVTALTEARKCTFATSAKPWRGNVWVF